MKKLTNKEKDIKTYEKKFIDFDNSELKSLLQKAYVLKESDCLGDYSEILKYDYEQSIDDAFIYIFDEDDYIYKNYGEFDESSNNDAQDGFYNYNVDTISDLRNDTIRSIRDFFNCDNLEDAILELELTLDVANIKN